MPSTLERAERNLRAEACTCPRKVSPSRYAHEQTGKQPWCFVQTRVSKLLNKLLNPFRRASVSLFLNEGDKLDRLQCSSQVNIILKPWHHSTAAKNVRSRIRLSKTLLHCLIYVYLWSLASLWLSFLTCKWTELLELYHLLTYTNTSLDHNFSSHKPTLSKTLYKCQICMAIYRLLIKMTKLHFLPWQLFKAASCHLLPIS